MRFTRYACAAIVAVLLSALVPVASSASSAPDQRLAFHQQEVVALVANTSALQLVMATSSAPAIGIAYTLAAPIQGMLMLPTQVSERLGVAATDPLNANTGLLADFTRPRPHGSGGYNVLKMPDARGTIAGRGSHLALRMRMPVAGTLLA